ncbi:MAG: FAD-binding protein, partial [Eggerthellaceae bacterium]|nr:FAD-binding protein [Eggerthellaceae bacterium]
MKDFSRRSFLIGAATAGIASAGMLAGCSTGGAKEEKPAMSWDLETEVLVIGAGGAGLTAAVAAQDAGAQVMIIEKGTVESEFGYGVTRSSGGNGCMVKNVEGALKYIKAQSLGFNDEEVSRAWAEQGMKLTDFL